ncbi:hypothetical protein P20429_1571 [Pseudoalteromonas sp. BSi20429]|nr:hypothetical protein P20429_1571 [Pseudoalteromonas sp. BSi20429]
MALFYFSRVFYLAVTIAIAIAIAITMVMLNFNKVGNGH